MRSLAVFMALAGLAAGPACTTGGERAPPAGSTLEATEIKAAGLDFQTAHDAVQYLRPQYLRTRANPTIGGAPRDPVRVYVNGTLWGTTDALHRIRIEEVVLITYFRPSDAQTRYGMNHGSGAIEVTTAGR